MHRDDALGIVIGDYLADHWPDKKIALLHDNTIFGKGIAETTSPQASGCLTRAAGWPRVNEGRTHRWEGRQCPTSW
jgi:hypothetical protein